MRTTREEFADAIRTVYEAVVERSTGRRVEAFASRLAPEHERPWTAEIFLLGPPTVFQAAMQTEFTAIVEQAPGRPVSAYLSQVRLGPRRGRRNLPARAAPGA